MKYFGSIDTALYQTYSCAQFFSGALGDAYSKRVVLAISFII
jgi:sugar phosphate permease